jgi:DNA-binding NarL/FixJ family response regulator
MARPEMITDRDVVVPLCDAGAVIVDPYPIVRHALCDLVERAGLWVAGVTAWGPTALAACKRLRPVIIVQEWDLDQGAWLCESVKALPWAPRVLVYTGNDAPDAVVAALHAGADSYLHKSTTVDDLVDAIQRTCAGERLWLPRRYALGPDRGCTDDQSELTEREKQVMALLIQRCDNQEIAAELNLAYQTVKNYVSTVLRKAGVTSRNELSARGLRVVPAKTA